MYFIRFAGGKQVFQVWKERTVLSSRRLQDAILTNAFRTMLAMSVSVEEA